MGSQIATKQHAALAPFPDAIETQIAWAIHTQAWIDAEITFCCVHLSATLIDDSDELSLTEELSLLQARYQELFSVMKQAFDVLKKAGTDNTHSAENISLLHNKLVRDTQSLFHAFPRHIDWQERLLQQTL